MNPEPHRLQQDPPEGDRDLIDRELARQDRKQQNETARDQLSGQEKQPGEGPSSDERAAEQLKAGAEDDAGKPAEGPGDRETDNSRAMDEAAPQTGVRPGP
ncbi:hypothetical protein [Gellertiella hungarica]|uniref:Uncharacterized protein n=1 Tax=Gellertiella hungarica TaxID=1572859 RepID=A0A7W6J4W5_9HYPH|nr:hypothetical protein [Gellertiella hungarica]MBB4064844.1 hypothetical protein [Gellertiella hungarica]